MRERAERKYATEEHGGQRRAARRAATTSLPTACWRKSPALHNESAAEWKTHVRHESECRIPAPPAAMKCDEPEARPEAL